MKILTIDTIKLKIPLNKPMRMRHIDLKDAYCLLVVIKTENSIVGQGLVRASNKTDIDVIDYSLQTIFMPQLIGESVIYPEKCGKAYGE